MTPDESIARATWGLVIATGGLILVTFFLVVDGIRKSREQNRRWKEEDERRADEAKPTAVVELATTKPGSLDILFAFFNLGNNTFFVDKMVVTAGDGTRHESDLSPRIVTPGTYVTISFEPSDLLGFFGEDVEFKEAQAIFVLKGATGAVTTEPVWFYVSYRRGGVGCAWGVGHLADREPGLITKFPKVLPDISPQPSSVDSAEVLDEYGNNVAVRCPACQGAFIFSKHLNKASGRSCPHCNRSKAILTPDGVHVNR